MCENNDNKHNLTTRKAIISSRQRFGIWFSWMEKVFGHMSERKETLFPTRLCLQPSWRRVKDERRMSIN